MDGRMLGAMARVMNDDTVKGLICFSCATISPYVKSWSYKTMTSDMWMGNSTSESPIKMYKVQNTLLKWLKETEQAFLDNFHFDTWKGRYASNNSPAGNPFVHCDAVVRDDNAEWTRFLKLPHKSQDEQQSADHPRLRLLCCPEDICQNHRDCAKHRSDEICEHCEVPICRSCMRWVRSAKFGYRIPMVLANDNWSGYTPEIIVKHKVRWIEAGSKCR